MSKILQSAKLSFCFIVYLVAYIVRYPGKFPVATIVILLLLKSRYQEDFIKKSGLCIVKKDIVRFFLIFGFFYIMAFSVINSILRDHHIFAVLLYPALIIFELTFQVLNEEIMLRAIALQALSDKLKSPIVATCISSLVFSFLHLLLYSYSSEVFLDPLTLFNLFLFGVLSSSLYFKTGNIACSYAIHLAWNLNRFGRTHFSLTQLDYIREGVTFNFIEGSWGLFFLGVFLLLGYLGVAYRMPNIVIKARKYEGALTQN